MERDFAAVETKNKDSKFDITTITYEELKEATKDFSEKLGKGGFGNVYKGHFGGGEVAVKMLLTPDDVHQIKAFHREVKILSRLHHKHLVHLRGVCPEKFALVYEYMPGGTLEDRLKDLLWTGRLRIATEICSALMFLHSAVPEIVVHGDIKPENILLDSDGTSKLADFGISHLILVTHATNTIQHTATSVQGSPGYLDPVFVQTRKLAPTADVYSFGMVLLRLLTNEQVGGALVGSVQDAIDENCLEDVLDVVAKWPKSLAEELSKIAIRCCDTRTKERPYIYVVHETLEEQVWLHCEVPKQIQQGLLVELPYSCLRRSYFPGSRSYLLGAILGKERVRSTKQCLDRGHIGDIEVTVSELTDLKVEIQVELLKRFKHPHVVHVVGKCTEKNLLVYGCAPRATLADRLADRSDFPWQDRLRIAIEICSVLVFFHSQEPEMVAYVEFHPDRVVLDANGKSHLCEVYSCTDPHCGSKGSIASSIRTDIDHFGVLLMHFLMRSALLTTYGINYNFLGEYERMKLERMKLSVDDVGDWPKDLAERLFHLIARCCNKDAERRPSAAEILEQLEQLKEYT